MTLRKFLNTGCIASEESVPVEVLECVGVPRKYFEPNSVTYTSAASTDPQDSERDSVWVR